MRYPLGRTRGYRYLRIMGGTLRNTFDREAEVILLLYKN